MIGEDSDDKARLYGDISDFVTLTVQGKEYQVPAELEVLRCLQYLDFHIAYENFCWNANCENCASKIACKGEGAKRELICQLEVQDGMKLDKLPEGVSIPEEKKD